MNKRELKYKKTKKFFAISGILVFISIIFGFFIDIKIVMIVLFSLLLFVAYILYKEKIGREIIIALLFALVVTSYYIYEYTTFNLFFGNINLFPLVAWTFGLVLLREMYKRTEQYKFLKVSLAYLIVLFFVEFIGYHILDIQLNSNFSGLFGLSIIHAPLGLKFFYVLAGPVYLLITDYLKID